LNKAFTLARVFAAALVCVLLPAGQAMAIKVYLAPSRQLSNHSPDLKYIEGNAMHTAADKLAAKLAARGIECRHADWNEEYGTSDYNARQWMADVVLAMHTNACCANDTGWHSNYGTQMFPYAYVDNYSLSYDLASKIGNKMVQKFGAFGIPTSLGVYSDTYSQFPSNTQARNILLEALFHDNWNDCTKVLQLDAGLDAYAQACFEGICDHFGMSYVANIEKYIEPRGQNNQYYQEDGNQYWGNSAGWCSFDSNLTSGGSRYYPSNTTGTTDPTGRWMQVRPVLNVPGGTYQIDVAHYDNDFISTDISTSIALTNCTAQSGDLQRNTTNAFRKGFGCQWYNLGTFALSPGQSQPTIKFTYSGGNVSNANNRWNVLGFRFAFIPTPSTLYINGCGGGTWSGSGAKTAGDTVTVTATPFPGLQFVGWMTGGCNGTLVSANSTYTFTMPGGNYTLYAKFGFAPLQLTTAACPSAGGTTTGGGTYTYGQSVTVTATPAPGYMFTNWTMSSCGGSFASSNASYTFSMPSSALSLYANFAPIQFEPVSLISDLWALPNSTNYKLSDKTVTAATGSTFWIEESDRTAALRVAYTGAIPARNSKVDVIGALDSSTAPRVLNAVSVTDKGVGNPIDPLALITRALGGASPSANTPSVTGGVGAYNLGMLVRIAGMAGSADTSDPNKKYFFLDDGSGLTDGLGHSGVKVICGTATPPASGVVRVTGIIGTETAGGRIVPVIIVRDPAEVNPL